MKIVIIGDGKVGHKLTTELSEEDYDIVLIDQNEGKLKEALNELDIFCITGNGVDAEIQKQAELNSRLEASASDGPETPAGNEEAH